jgi:hypothetical protein
MPTKYVVSSTHAVDLASGRVVANGEAITLKDDEVKDPHNEGLVDQGVLVELSTGRKATKKEG